MNFSQTRKQLSWIVRQPILAFLYLYSHYISLLFLPRCRFYPSCSRYTYEAVYKHGALSGLRMALRRISKCHPWHEGGIDPVPEPKNSCCPHKPQTSTEYLS